MSFKLTIKGVELYPVRRGSTVWCPFDAELVITNIVGLQISNVQVHCKKNKTNKKKSTLFFARFRAKGIHAEVSRSTYVWFLVQRVHHSCHHRTEQRL